MLRKTSVSVGDGIFWIERDGTIEVSDGSIDVAFSSLNNAPVVVGERVIRIEFDA